MSCTETFEASERGSDLWVLGEMGVTGIIAEKTSWRSKIFPVMWTTAQVETLINLLSSSVPRALAVSGKQGFPVHTMYYRHCGRSTGMGQLGWDGMVLLLFSTSVILFTRGVCISTFFFIESNSIRFGNRLRCRNPQPCSPLELCIEVNAVATRCPIFSFLIWRST